MPPHSKISIVLVSGQKKGAREFSLCRKLGEEEKKIKKIIIIIRFGFQTPCRDEEKSQEVQKKRDVFASSRCSDTLLCLVKKKKNCTDSCRGKAQKESLTNTLTNTLTRTHLQQKNTKTKTKKGKRKADHKDGKLADFNC